jgi:hypothetical protein
MKTLMLSLPALCIAVLFVFAGCDMARLPPDYGAAPGIDFKVNGVYIEVDTESPDPFITRRVAFSGNPIRIEGIPEDENAMVSYMFMNGSVSYTNPVLVYLDTPFADIAPRATLRVIVTAENGAENDYFLDMEAVGQNVLEMRVMN